MENSSISSALKGTKAETLLFLAQLGYTVPKVYFFNVNEWLKNQDVVLANLYKVFSEGQFLAIRSSTKAEDSEDASHAGAFESLLNINSAKNIEVITAIEKVISSYDDTLDNQVLIQPMVSDVAMSGVVMTKVLDDGSPYYVVNYDDTSGLTDTVTSGVSINKTVYIYNGVEEKDFDSPYLLTLMNLVWSLEKTFPDIPLDIEFAVDKKGVVHLFQVRRITTLNNWKLHINTLVSNRIQYLGEYVDKLMKPRGGLSGSKTLLGIMPDWNPAEMIGVIPHPLAMSLYRELITKSTWRLAREKMGYRKMPNVELMVSLFGRSYIDVRNSINSFLPDGLDTHIADKLVDAYIKRLEADPHLHDKIEFEVVHTAYDFDFEENFNSRYPNILTKEEFLKYRGLLRVLTKNAIVNLPSNTINIAYKDIEYLKSLQDLWKNSVNNNPFELSDQINTLLGECVEFGTMPFSVIARHGFIAESLLRSAVSKGALTVERAKEFRRSVQTIASDMSIDFYNVCNSKSSKESFIKKYGHLRPSSYDLLSPTYSNRKDLFDGNPHTPSEPISYTLTDEENRNLNILLAENGFDGITANDMLLHAKKAIVGREYAKFIFTKHLSLILELIADWGLGQGFTREDMTMLTLNEILSILFSPLTDDVKSFYKSKIENAKISYDVACSFKLSYLIRSTRDIFVVPQQRSTPNFIGNQRIEAEIVILNPYTKVIPDMRGKIVCIEGADPGYDWIFSREIAGLVTKYGGANSHMAIRCAEYGLPAAIGCGEQPFERVVSAGKCLIDGQAKRLEPLSIAIN